ncbi:MULTISPECIES: ABC transporter permease [unclassified Streptomyces]|uniref:ABC transporter permease n=1 Tax=unclassified Streptomyces TaxID=2593676 RepID=UPI002238A101|nr:ABC transporter permease [Streptomyces sp. SHP 1-2]MCW5249553.1 ABC transporter permease [Streptomyces sp. SHP 1-2]
MSTLTPTQEATASDGSPAARSPKPPRGVRLRRALLGVNTGRIGVVLVFLALWQLASGRWIEDYLISSPVKVAERCIDLIRTGQINEHFQATAIEFVLGYVCGVLLGLLLGLALGAWPTVGRVLEPLISALNGIPKIALAPLLILWLGIGIESKVGIAAMTVFFVMFYNVYIGMRSVPTQLVNAMRIFGAGKVAIIRTVVLPCLTSAILAGLRSGVPFAIIGVIVGEFVASTHGLGYYIRRASDAYDAAGIFAGIAFLMVLVFAMNLVVTVWERRVTRWQR